MFGGKILLMNVTKTNKLSNVARFVHALFKMLHIHYVCYNNYSYHDSFIDQYIIPMRFVIIIVLVAKHNRCTGFKMNLQRSPSCICLRICDICIKATWKSIIPIHAHSHIKMMFLNHNLQCNYAHYQYRIFTTNVRIPTGGLLKVTERWHSFYNSRHLWI